MYYIFFSYFIFVCVKYIYTHINILCFSCSLEIRPYAMDKQVVILVLNYCNNKIIQRGIRIVPIFLSHLFNFQLFTIVENWQPTLIRHHY